jgi:hypothetical protein
MEEFDVCYEERKRHLKDMQAKKRLSIAKFCAGEDLDSS